MKNILYVVVIIFALYFVFGLFKKDIYKGWVYPNGCLSCSTDWISSPEFESRQSCLNWASDILRRRNNPADDFECAKNCEPRDGFNVCEETFDN
mgnify:CR=1 FL=1